VYIARKGGVNKPMELYRGMSAERPAHGNANHSNNAKLQRIINPPQAIGQTT
jgi:hypothetical protein